MSTADDRAGVLQHSSEPESLTQPRESDTSLVARMKAGEVEALSLIFDRYSPVVFAMLLDLLEDSAAAEEVLRDLFVQLWQRAADFDPGSGSLPAWLMVTAHNLALARLRASRPQNPADDFETYPANGMPSPFEDEQQLRMIAEQLRKALAGGRREERHAMQLAYHAMELAYFEGLTQSEIARQTGSSREALRLGLLRTINSLIETYGNARQIGRL